MAPAAAIDPRRTTVPARSARRWAPATSAHRAGLRRGVRGRDALLRDAVRRGREPRSPDRGAARARRGRRCRRDQARGT
jgi:hypothetical protein